MSQTNTPSQHWQAQTYADNARFVADYGVSLLDWLQADKGERILDLGCGDGQLLAALVEEKNCIAYGVELDTQDVRNADTIEDLFNIVKERKA